jgi:hypothetical protein
MELESQMVSISQLVDDSLARHGVEPTFDYLRLEWSKWFRCDSSFSVVLAPSKAGIFALAEEIISAIPEGIVGARASSPVQVAERSADKRMLALFEIKQTDDIGMALGRLFLPGNPLREKLESGKCLARYTVIEDSGQRSSAYEFFSAGCKTLRQQVRIRTWHEVLVGIRDACIRARLQT